MMIRLATLFVTISKHFNDRLGKFICTLFINVTKHFCGAANGTRYTLLHAKSFNDHCTFIFETGV